MFVWEQILFNRFGFYRLKTISNGLQPRLRSATRSISSKKLSLWTNDREKERTRKNEC